METWWRDVTKRSGKRSRIFSGLKTDTNYIKSEKCQKKVYNKHFIIIATWSGIRYHVSWMRPYHWITLNASRLGPNPLDLIQYARSRYYMYYDNVYLSQYICFIALTLAKSLGKCYCMKKMYGPYISTPCPLTQLILPDLTWSKVRKYMFIMNYFAVDILNKICVHIPINLSVLKYCWKGCKTPRAFHTLTMLGNSSSSSSLLITPKCSASSWASFLNRGRFSPRILVRRIDALKQKKKWTWVMKTTSDQQGHRSACTLTVFFLFV